jgi:hypothetical protein
VRKLALIISTGGRWLDGQLVDSGIADVANHRPQPSAVFGESRCECFEKRPVGRRIGGSKIIHRIHNAHSHKVSPETVDHIAIEEVVGGFANPCRERSTGITGSGHGFHSTGKLRGNRASVHGMHRRRGCGVEHDTTIPTVASGFALDAGEEADKSVVVVHCPAIERVIVAFGALHANAEEQLREVGGQHFGIEPIVFDEHGVQAGLTVSVCAADSGRHLGDHFIEGAVGSDLVAKPRVKRVGGLVRIRRDRCSPGC